VHTKPALQILFLVQVCVAALALAGDEAPVKKAGPSDSDVAARKQISIAKDLFEGQQSERAIKVLENILVQYPTSRARYEVYLMLGRFYAQGKQGVKANQYLALLRKEMEPDEEKLSHDEKDMLVEALYWAGVSYFQNSERHQALPLLRKLTERYPNTIWANQAYFYIGMCHYADHNWARTIEALNLVGTSIDPDSPSVEYVEAGWRFYVKIQDGDLPVLRRLGKQITVSLETKSGDKESITCSPLSTQGDIYIGSIQTQVGAAKANDQMLQVIGGDEITVRYVDANTQDGKREVLRESKVQVVSSATLNFTLGTYDSLASAAYLGQPVFLLLNDLDKDVSDQSDTAQIKLVSRYKVTDEDQPRAERPKDGEATKASALDEGDIHEIQYKTRDEVVLNVKEIGQAPVHTGRFGGSVKIERYEEGKPVDKNDDILTCAVGDEVVATYMDEVNINGKSPREVIAKLTVVGEIVNTPHATTYGSSDPVIKSRKCITEARGYLDYAKVFKSMGLTKGANEMADQGLSEIEEVIRLQDPIPSALKEEAYSIKWSLLLLKENFRGAMDTCKLFNKLFPDSPLVDQALMSIGKIKFESQNYDEAAQIFTEILSMPNSQVKAEAQFNLAQATEKSKYRSKEQAIEQYKICAAKYPESPYAGQALGQMVEYYIRAKDYAQANDLLDRIFQDYPDAEFLDQMLYKAVIAAYNSSDFKRAYAKANQLLSEYPSSKDAATVKNILPRIEKRLK
jgi:TolA-binding protein